MKKALALLSCAAVALLASGSVEAAPKKKRPPAPKIVPFSATAEVGQRVEILRHGPLTLFLACHSGTRFDNGAPVDFALLSVTTNENDTLVTGSRGHKFPAGFSVDLFTATVPSPDGGWLTPPETIIVNGAGTDFAGSGGAALKPSGWYLNVPADTTTFGLHVYRFSITPHAWEQAPDCFVIGEAHLQRVDVLP